MGEIFLLQFGHADKENKALYGFSLTAPVEYLIAKV